MDLPEYLLHCLTNIVTLLIANWCLLILLNTFCHFCLSDDFSDCCSHDDMASGCRLERSSQAGSSSGPVECLCGVGCDREFQFKTLAECEAKLKCKCESDILFLKLDSRIFG